MRGLGAVVLVMALAACGQQAGAGGGPDTPVTSGASAAGASVRGAVEGTVRGRGGAVLRGALVLPRSVDSPAKPVPEMAVVTDARGRYRWTLESGRYELTVYLDGKPVGSPRTVTVEAGRTTTADW